MMNRRQFMGTTAAALTAMFTLNCGRTARKPNIVLIMVDDMGFSDIGCYGGEISTPNIDRLAANGLRYKQFYNTARCCPTRASLLTGLYPHQTGMGWMTAADLGRPAYSGDLNQSCQTIAEVLKPQGYRTYLSGKWHVTSFRKTGPDGPKDTWPLQRGFDRFFGTIEGSGNFYDPNTLTLNNTQIPADKDFYYTDVIGDHAVQNIQLHQEAGPETPFFMYVAFTAPHWPLHAKPQDIAKYQGKYLKGWDALRAERQQRMRKLDLIDEQWDLTDRDPNVPSWDEIEPDDKALWDKRMAIYAAQIDNMDQNVGRIIDALEQSGQLDNTLLFFLSDNGGCAEAISNGDTSIKALGTKESFESYRINWANASNTPFREYKHWVHEGGISTPLIVHWPAGFAAKNEWRNTPGHVIDIMATCVDVSGADYPAQTNGHAIHPYEGKSLTTTFTNQPLDREAIYWEHEANCAIRMGKWKLVSKALPEPPYQGPWELYDMDKDRTETTNLAAQHPERVKQMAAKWQTWAERCDVLPLDGRGWYERLNG